MYKMKRAKYKTVLPYFLLLYSTALVLGRPETSVEKVQHLVKSNANINKEHHSTWHCPPIINITGLLCMCDAPHTIRCRGHIHEPNDVKVITHQLMGHHKPEVSLLEIAVHGVRYLPSGTFNDLHLLGLIISEAEFDGLSKDSFKGVESNLSALGLPQNQLNLVPKKALSILKHLEKLDLSENRIYEITTHGFPNLPRLQSLNLAGNGIRILEPEAFAGLPQLKELILSGNQIETSQIKGNTFRGLQSLAVLSLSSNLLKGSLSPDFISNTKRLISLNLSHNQITKVLLGALESCPNLESLDLSYNSIDIIEDHSFRNLSRLQHLDFSHNRIIAVSGWSLAHLPNLKILSFADNALFAVTADLLHQLRNLTSLDVSANDISLLQPNVFGYTPKLKELAISDNPLHCDCSLKWFLEWLEKKKENKANIGAICMTPPKLENTPLIDLNVTQLECIKRDSHQDKTDENDRDTEELEDIPLSSAIVSLRDASWVGEDVQLVWHVDKQAIPYNCQAVHIYEIEKFKESVHQILAEKIEINCSSDNQVDPKQVVVTIPRTVVEPGKFYRYCLVLIERGTGDAESFLPGCSKTLFLNNPSVNTTITIPEIKISSLTVGNMGMSLAVQTKVTGYNFLSCVYTLFVISNKIIEGYQHLNCSQSRYAFSSLKPGNYRICASPKRMNFDKNVISDFQNKLKNSKNELEILNKEFSICTTMNLHAEQNYVGVKSLAILLFTIPGLALMITIYVLGRRVWKGGGRWWRWDPRASKSVKYFLYTGDTTTPSASLESIPEPESTV